MNFLGNCFSARQARFSIHAVVAFIIAPRGPRVGLYTLLLSTPRAQQVFDAKSVWCFETVEIVAVNKTPKFLKKSPHADA